MFRYINSLIQKIKSSEKGQGMVEYALIIAFVAAIAIYAFQGELGENVRNTFQNASDQVADAQEGANANGQ